MDHRSPHPDEVLRGKKARRDEAPGTVPAVHRNCIQRIVQVQLEAHLHSDPELRVSRVPLTTPYQNTDGKMNHVHGAGQLSLQYFMHIKGQMQKRRTFLRAHVDAKRGLAGAW